MRNPSKFDRMWKVIVGGGIALVTGSLGVACSSGGVTPQGDAFPTEGPSEGSVPLDTGTSDADAAVDAPKDTTSGDASDGGGG